ncbi:MAG: DUF3754 domain-containing protein [Mariniblastus sp.]
MNDTSEDKNLVGRIEDDPIARELPERATFIPLRQTDLRAKLAEEYGVEGEELDNFNHLCGRLQAIFHVEHLSALLHLEELYDSLDPDSQLVDLDTMDETIRNRLANTLIDRVSGLLFSAHYKRLTRQELESAIEIGWQWGVQLEVDFDLFDRLEIFARGYRTVEVSRRRWQNFYRKETIELPEFQRLIMAFRVNPDPDEEKSKGKKNNNPDETLLSHKFVYLKTFKNIPETDLEILLPGSKVRLTKLDRAKIILPTLSGMAITGYKITRGLLVLALAFTLKNLIVWAAVIGAVIGYVVKSVLSYFRTKTKYQFGLTQSLYLKNLDNNSSVIYRILNEAEEQELCEAILAYTILWKHSSTDAVRSKGGLTEKELDDIVEAYLLKVTGIDVDFEVHDAIGKLARLGLAEVDHGGNWTVAGIKDTTDYLNRNWNALFEARARAVGTGEPLKDDLFTT